MSNTETVYVLGLLLLGVVVLVFFFYLPQQKQKKKDELFFKVLKPGDGVVTIGGFHGVVVEVKDQQVLLQSAGGARFLIERGSISREGTEMIYRKEPVKTAPVGKKKAQKDKKQDKKARKGK